MTPFSPGDFLADLRTRRKAARISMATLAAAMGVGWTQSVISERERGIRQTTLTQLAEWSDALDAMVNEKGKQ